MVKLFFDLASVAKQDWKFSSVFALSSVKNYISSAENIDIDVIVLSELCFTGRTFKDFKEGMG